MTSIESKYVYQRKQSTAVYKDTAYLYGRIYTISLGSFCVGFNLIFYYTMPQWIQGFGERQWWYQLIGAIIPITAIIGSIGIGYYLEKCLSRRHLLMTSAIIGIIGSIFSIFSFLFSSNSVLFNFPLFIIGRIFQGIMVGIDMTFCLVIINQFSPQQVKLTSICIYQMTIELGILIPTIIFPLIKLLFNISWKQSSIIMYSITIVILIIQFLLLGFIYKQQSPVYLLEHKKQQEAKSILQSIYNQQYVQQKFLQYKQQAISQKSYFHEHYNQKVIWRKGLLLGLYAVMVQQMSGIYFLNVVGLYFIRQLKYFQIFLNAFPYICQFLGTLTLLIINRIPRLKNCFWRANRKSIIQFGSISFVILTISALVLQTIKINKRSRQFRYYWYIIQSLMMYMFGLTLGAIVWVYLSQMLKSKQIQIVIAFYWILASINIFGFSVLDVHCEIFVPIILSVSCIILSILNKWYLIETKNQSSLQIIRKLDNFKFCLCIESNQ